MTVETPAAFNQAGSYSGEQTRRAIFADVYAAGIKTSADLFVTAGSGLSANVAAGQALVKGTTGASQGFYYLYNTGTLNETFAAANATNPRIDAVVATIQDSQYAGSADAALIQVLTGTPTSGATLSNLNGAPSIPASSLVLAYVLIPASASSINSADILNEQVTSGLYSVPQVPYGSLYATAGNTIPNNTLSLQQNMTPRYTLAYGMTQNGNALVVPVSGLYLVTVTGGLAAPSAGGWLFVSVSTNGGTSSINPYGPKVAIPSGGVSFDIGQSWTRPLVFAAGTTVNLCIYQSTGVSQTSIGNQGETDLTVQLLAQQ